MEQLQEAYRTSTVSNQTSKENTALSPRFSLPTRPLKAVEDTVSNPSLSGHSLGMSKDTPASPYRLSLPTRPLAALKDTPADPYWSSQPTHPIPAVHRRDTPPILHTPPSWGSQAPVSLNHVESAPPSHPSPPPQPVEFPTRVEAREQKTRSARLKRQRVPEMRQMNAVECGAACLAMILNYYGRATSISEIQERCGVGRDGLSALAIVKAARQYGLRVRAISLKRNDFRFVTLPAIVHWEFNHFVIVERWSTRQVTIVDPALGRRSLTTDEFDEGFTGVIIMLEAGQQFERQAPQPSLSLRTYLRSLLQMRGIIAQIIGTSLLLQILGLTLPLLTEIVVDHIIPAQASDLLTQLAVGMLFLILVRGATSLLRASLLIYLQTHLDAQLMLNFIEHLLSLPYRFFQLRLNGDLLSRMNSNIAIRDLLTSQLISTLLDGSTIIVYFVVLCSQSHLMAAVTVLIGAFQVGLILLTAPSIRRLTLRDLAAQGKTQGYLNEVLSGIATVKAAGAEQRTFSRWMNLFFEEMNISVRLSYLSSVVGIALDILQTLSPVLLLWIGSLQVIRGTLSVGTMLALDTLAISFLAPLNSLAAAGQKLQVARAHFERIADVVEAESEQKPQQLSFPLQLSGHIEVRDVSFQYDPNTPPVLQDINLRIWPGQKVALVGKTGSGKSTLGKLLLGLMAPTNGRIVFDGFALENLNYREVRRQFGVVLQESCLFTGSVRENIAFNNPEMDMAQVIKAAQAAAIHEDIEKLPMGYETQVSEGGSVFSGGQRQRLALARALASQPAILLLDEATSALDVTTERVVEQNLRRLSCTQIVIAHRLSTIRNADLILVLDGGRLVEKGTHDQLLRWNTFYAQLIKTQLANGEIAAA